MSAELLTFHDTYEHLLDVFDQYGRDQEGVVRRARRAVSEGYGLLASQADWRYWVRETMVTTSAKQTSGTIAYTSSTGRVTLSDATWPSDVEFGFVVIEDVRYRVERSISSTVIELKTDERPTDDVASGTSYEWQRYRYLLPLDCGHVREVIDSEQHYGLARVTPNYSLWRSEVLFADAYPSHFTVVRSDKYPGRWELWLVTTTTVQRQLRVQYDAKWSRGFVDEVSTGTVSTTDDVATFSSSVLNEHSVGCVLRVSTDTNAPTPRVGQHDDDLNRQIVHLPAEERLITAYNSATEAVLNRALSDDASSVAYTISTHIDVPPGAMRTFFFRLCEEQYLILTRATSEEVAQANALTRQAWTLARIEDSQSSPSRNTFAPVDEVVVEEDDA